MIDIYILLFYITKLRTNIINNFLITLKKILLLQNF